MFCLLQGQFGSGVSFKSLVLVHEAQQPTKSKRLTAQVLATNGDTHLGGEDFDQRVMQYFMKIFKKKTGVDITGDKKAIQKLRREVRACVRAKGACTQRKLSGASFYCIMPTGLHVRTVVSRKLAAPTRGDGGKNVEKICHLPTMYSAKKPRRNRKIKTTKMYAHTIKRKYTSALLRIVALSGTKREVQVTLREGFK